MKRTKEDRLRERGELKEYIRSNRNVFIFWSVLRLIVILAMVRSAMLGMWDNVFICLLTLVLFMLPLFIRRRFGIELPSTMQMIIIFHIFACEILGELSCYYVKYEYWDTIMHTAWGFLCAALGFSLVDILNHDNRRHFSLSPAYVAIMAFCFSMTIGVLWEFFEFGADRLFMIDMQKDTIVTSFASVMLDETNSNIPIVVSGITDTAINGQPLGLGGYLDIGLFDTMEDLFVNFIGALVFSVIGYFALKKNSNVFVSHFVPRLADDEQQPEA